MKKKLGAFRVTGRRKAKVAIYFPTDMQEEILTETERQNRPISWLMQEAWTLAREAVAQMPDHRGRVA